MQYQIPVPHPPPGGPKVEQTHPVPGVARIEMSRYQLLHYVRPLTVIIQPIPGPTNQQTHPIAVFGQPNLALFIGRQYPSKPPELDQAVVAGNIFSPIQPPILTIPRQYSTLPFIAGGATNQQTHPTPQTAQIEMSRYTLLDRVRQIPISIVDRNQGAITQQTIPIPSVAQIEMSRYLALKASLRIPEANRYFEGAISQQTHPTPAVSTIQMAQWLLRERIRLIPGTIAEYNQGPTNQRTDPILRFGDVNLALYPNRQHQGVLAPIIVAPTQDNIFAISQPDSIGYIKRQYPGVINPIIVAPTQDIIFVPKQPNLAWYTSPQHPYKITTIAETIPQQTAPILVFGQPLYSLYPSRRYPTISTELEVTPIITQSDAFRVFGDTLLYYLETRQYNRVTPQFDINDTAQIYQIISRIIETPIRQYSSVASSFIHTTTPQIQEFTLATLPIGWRLISRQYDRPNQVAIHIGIPFPAGGTGGRIYYVDPNNNIYTPVTDLRTFDTLNNRFILTVPIDSRFFVVDNNIYIFTAY